jgi:hypothetical protein
MRSLLPLAAAGGAGMLWHTLPRWVKIPAVVGLVALGAIELTKDGSEAFNAAAIFGGQGEQGTAQMASPKTTLADSAAGKDVSGAKLTVAAQWQGLAADAIQKQAVADAASLSEQELLAKQAKGIKLTSTESLRILELKRARAESETAEAQSTAARAQALAEKQAAELNSRIIESMNNGSFIDTMIDLSGVRAALPDVPRFSGKRR